MKKDELRNVEISVEGFYPNNIQSSAFQTFKLPGDKELGCAINKMVHDNDCDMILVRVRTNPSISTNCKKEQEK